METVPTINSSEGATDNRLENFEFHGTGKEYFGIWIVNIFLTVLTLGIYSAWAKVRRTRYFYGNTTFDGYAFEYHADPITILKGRIIVFVYFVILNILTEFYPEYGLVMILITLLIYPWFLVKGLQFNARMTSYRNVRFHFTGGLSGAFKLYIPIWGPIALFVLLLIIEQSIGLVSGPDGTVNYIGVFLLISLLILPLFIYPLYSKWYWEYVSNNLSFGDKEFSASVELVDVYKNAFLAPFLIFTAFILGFLVYIVTTYNVFDGAENALSIYVSVILHLSKYPQLIIVGLVLFFFASIIYAAAVRNITFNSTTIDYRHQLKSSFNKYTYLFIIVTNTLATLCTLGLARPWAAVRLANYKAENTAILLDGPVDEIISQTQETQSAIGSEYLDVEGIDFGF